MALPLIMKYVIFAEKYFSKKLLNSRTSSLRNITGHDFLAKETNYIVALEHAMGLLRMLSTKIISLALCSFQTD